VSLFVVPGHRFSMPLRRVHSSHTNSSPSGAVLSVIIFCCAVQTAWSRRKSRTEQEVGICRRGRLLVCASFHHTSCEDCSFVWPPSPPFFFHAFLFNINSFFTILRRAARLLFTVTDVAIHGCPHGRVGNKHVHIGFLMSGTDHVPLRCIDLVAGVPSWYYLGQQP